MAVEQRIRGRSWQERTLVVPPRDMPQPMPLSVARAASGRIVVEARTVRLLIRTCAILAGLIALLILGDVLLLALGHSTLVTVSPGGGGGAPPPAAGAPRTEPLEALPVPSQTPPPWKSEKPPVDGIVDASSSAAAAGASDAAPGSDPTAAAAPAADATPAVPSVIVPVPGDGGPVYTNVPTLVPREEPGAAAGTN